MRKQDAGKLGLAGLFVFALGYGCGLLNMGGFPRDEQVGVKDVCVVVSGAGNGTHPVEQRSRGRVSGKWTKFLQMMPKRSDYDPVFFHRTAEQFSDDELLELIAAYTRLAPHDLPRGVPLADVASRLAEVYYGDSHNRTDNPLDNSGLTADIEFGVATGADNLVTELLENFGTNDRRIYASFEMLDYTERQVMVKWSRIDSPEVLVYDKYPIMSGVDNNYIWLEQSQGWDGGEYQVEIYSLADNLSLLARGQYNVN